MKKSFLLYLFVSASTLLWSCSGDCVSCHSTLNVETDVRHKSLATCVSCHTTESLSMSDMGAACGQDCFACHDAGKLRASSVEAHGVINGCVACHSTLKNGLPAMNWQDQLKAEKPKPFGLP